jgi:DNA-directed RNA polymerase subunit M/transcription elongation factor TFIIS
MAKTDKSTKKTTDESGPKAVSFVGQRPKAKKGPEVNMPCQRGKDLKTKGQHCDSKRAYNTSAQQGGKNASFECIKCGHQWTVAMGGSFTGP